MQIEALLCDAVSVREGLLHILGGGISRVHRPAYPAPLGINLALRITLPRATTASNAEHEVKIVLRKPDDAGEVASVVMGFRSQGEPSPPPAEIAFPAAVPLRDLLVPAQGHYLIEIHGDGVLLRSFPIEAALPAQRPHPNA